jgi:hypothetical protein
MTTWLLIVMAIAEVVGGMGMGMLFRDWQNRVLYTKVLNQVIYTIDLSLIHEDEEIWDFINRAHTEKLGTYIIK